jgi:hypothetical protein
LAYPPPLKAMAARSYDATRRSGTPAFVMLKASKSEKVFDNNAI